MIGSLQVVHSTPLQKLSNSDLLDMEYGGAGLVHNSSALIGSLSEFKSVETAEGDFIDELLVEGCWLETTAGGGSYNFMHPSCDSLALADPSPQHYLPLPASEMPDEISFVAGKRWWIGPRANPGPSSSVKERLMVAVGYLKEYTKNTNVLIQIWVPPAAAAAAARRGLHLDDHYHHRINDHETTLPVVGFPMSPTPNPNPNVNVRFFRSHDYPRVHYEQAQQQQYDARGSLALPVFERGTGTCLGVLEILITNQHFFNYRPQLDNLCNALEAVDFRSCQNLIIPPAIKVFDELYQAALNEIVEVLTSVCKTHNLPLGLTWAPCIQQGKCGCGPSSSPDACCVSTVDSACFVADLDILGFQEACSEYHLFRGQGIVGTAFTTTKPCFAIDITAFSKAEYPLAHHAKMFGLHAAVAIPLRSVYTGSSADFVLEFFLPKDCRDSEEQKHMLNSLSMLVQQACRSLHVAAEDEFTWPVPPPPHDREESHHHHHHHHDDHHKLLFACPSSQPQPQMEEACSKESSSSWIAHMMEAQVQQKGKGVCVSLEYQLEEPKEEFKVTTNWDTIKEHGQVFSDFEHIEIEQSSVSGSGSGSGSRSGSRASAEGAGGEECYAFGGRRSSSASGGRKSGDKRRTKAEKTISLPVLRQYFAGSLKDAAKSIGVCPTTLKRICRQHGITRWPSRKIKKVGHSLKKLQLVIDSVQGAEGAIQIGSFYASFPELSSADCGRSDQSSQKVVHNGGSLYGNGNGNGDGGAAACSQTTFGASAGNQLASAVMMNTMSGGGGGGDVAMTQEIISCDAALLLNRSVHSAEAELQHASSASIQLQDQDTKHFTTTTRSKTTHSQPPCLSAWNSRDRGAFRVKATFVDEKIRFSLQPNWGIRDLQLEIARRFNLNDISNMDIKYLDDDGEWVLLACDADLEECKDLHRSSQTRTIRLSLFQASPLNLPNTFGSSNSPS